MAIKNKKRFHTKSLKDSFKSSFANLGVQIENDGIALLNGMAFKNSVDLGAGLGGFSFFEVDLAEIAGLAWVPIGGGDVTADLWIFSVRFIIGLKDQERCFSEISSGEGSSSYSSLSLQVGLKGRVGWGRRRCLVT